MTTTQQPLALKLAEAVKTHEHHPQYKFYGMVSDELIRLHARVQDLEADLVKEAARTASEKTRADQMSLQHDTQAALNRDARNQLAQLTVQLEAIGAGVVESLRGAKPLTDEEIMELFEKHYSHDQPQGQYFVEIVRHAERAHKIGA